MPTRKKDNPTCKVYKKSQVFDPEFDVHIIDASAGVVTLSGVRPLKVGQEATILCLDATGGATVTSLSPVTFAGTSDQLSFNTGSSVILRAISLTNWIVMVNNGITAN